MVKNSDKIACSGLT